jgi:hypothetical protein
MSSDFTVKKKKMKNLINQIKVEEKNETAIDATTAPFRSGGFAAHALRRHKMRKLMNKSKRNFLDLPRGIFTEFFAKTPSLT